MACNTCTTACDIYPCYENLWLFKATANASYLVVLTNMGTGRKESEQVTADSEGFVILTGGTWNNFFHTNSQVRFEIFEMVGSTYTNIPVDFQVITGFSGGSYASQQATISTNLYDCIYVSFGLLTGEDGDAITIDNQYLFNTNA
jgi:hypothetical protein